MQEDVLEFHRALTQLVRAYQFRDRDAICCYDVSPVQSHGLEVLQRSGPMTMTEFATALFLEKSSATRLADGLERKGYVTRKRRRDDARIHQLELTKRGGMLARKIEEDLVGERERLLADFTPTERNAAIRAVSALASAASSQARALSEREAATRATG